MTRATAIGASWVIWLIGLYIAFTTRIPQGVLLLIMLSGFVPYIVSIQLVEPWLMRRIEAASRAHASHGGDEG
jgi:cell division protein FtsW (lipid II flippase)